jgi:hypothetical protein
MPATDCPSRAAALSDAVVAMLLPCDGTNTALIQQTRAAFVTFCQAHPQYADVRRAWSEFHRHLQTELTQPT